MMTRDPWFFRRRTALFGIIYGLAFWIGFSLDAFLRHGAPLTTAEVAGELYGALGMRLILIVALLLTAAGWALRWWGSSYLGPRVVWPDDVVVGPLRVAGPFRYTRNPLYVGNVLQAMGIAVLAPPETWVILVAGTTIFAFALIAVEERALRTAHGPAYDAFARAVPRFVPRPIPAPIGTGIVRPDLRHGFIAETMTFGFVLAVAIVAVGGVSNATFIACWIVVAISIVVGPRLVALIPRTETA